MTTETVRERRMFALAEQLQARLPKAHGQVDALTLSLTTSLGHGGTGFARAFKGQLELTMNGTPLTTATVPIWSSDQGEPFNEHRV